MSARPHVQRLVDRARGGPPLAAGFVYPCDRDALQLAVAGAFAGYLAPVLVGPAARIRALGSRWGLDTSRMLIIDTADDPRAASVQAAIAARAGRLQALVRGSLGDEDLLAPVAAPDSGLRTSHRLSHAYFVDVPGRAQGLLVADARLNVAPPLAAKKDILHNTIELARALGIAEPRVAVLAAVDGVNPAFASTAEAAALKVMGQQGLFGDAIVDGPLAVDTALSTDVARTRHVDSPVAGRPDVLLAPTMEAATMLVRTLTAAAGAFAAGLVLGAQVPIIAPLRSDPMEARMAACVMAALAVAAASAPRPRAAASPPPPGDTPAPRQARAAL